MAPLCSEVFDIRFRPNRGSLATPLASRHSGSVDSVIIFDSRHGGVLR